MYSDITEMPFKVFLSLYCDGDKTKLYRSGKPPRVRDYEAEIERFSQICSLFADSFGSDTERASRINEVRKKEMERLTAIILSGALMIYDTRHFTDEVKKILRTLRVRLTGDRNKDIDIINARLSESLRKLNEMETDTADSKEIKMDREYFYGMLTSMSVWFKFNISEDITMYQYCEYARRMVDGIKEQRRHNDGLKTKKGKY